MAAELGLAWWKRHLSKGDDTGPNVPVDEKRNGRGIFGSIVSVSGPLLSYPTLAPSSPTPLLIVHSSSQSDATLPPGAITAYKKGYKHVTEKMSTAAGMPASREGWKPIMEFWSKHLGRRQVEGLYEVMSGIVPP